jgi:hypothetical protein
MATELQTAPQTESQDAPQPACCPWRSTLQAPLFLCAAAGLAFAGQHAWQNRTDIRTLWSQSVPALTCFNSTPCNAGQSLSGCALAHAAGCAEGSAVAEADADETVSALAPENAVTEL